MSIKILVQRYYYFIFLLIISSCAGSSEIITMSSRNISQDEIQLTSAVSLNPTIMPLCYEKTDTLPITYERVFGNYPNPANPNFSVHLLYGLKDYYSLGGGADISLFGYTIIMNNKIGFSDIINHEMSKKIGISYYNKSSFTRGNSAFPSSYDPFKKGHFEIGNYFIIGIFLNQSELIFAPHIDLNYLMSRTHEYPGCSDLSEYYTIASEITNSNIFYMNYGINIAFKTKDNFFIEAGIQYIDSNIRFYEPIRKSNFQFSVGAGFSIKLREKNE